MVEKGRKPTFLTPKPEPEITTQSSDPVERDSDGSLQHCSSGPSSKKRKLGPSKKNTNSSSGPSSKMSKLGPSKKKINRFFTGWLEIPEFKEWLEKSSKKRGENDVAYCKICDADLAAHKSEIKRHRYSSKHQKHEKEITSDKIKADNVSKALTSDHVNVGEMGEILMDESYISDESENLVITEIESSDTDAEFPTEYETRPPLLKEKKSDDTKIQMRLEEAYSLLRSSVQSKRKRDDCEVYGELVAMKLRKMDDITRDIAMIKIDNLLFEMKIQPNKHTHVGKKKCQYIVLPQETINSLSQQTSKEAKFANFSTPSSTS